jgi:uncharacterized membrane protein
MSPLLLLAHLCGVAIWVGGMFFAYLCLAPSVGVLEAPQRLTLLRGVFARFFRWVWVAIALIFASGIATFGAAGPAAMRPSWLVMMVIGIAMVVVFLVVQRAVYPAMCSAIDAADWKAAGAAAGKIRRLVGVNLTLGVLTMADATLGRWAS